MVIKFTLNLATLIMSTYLVSQNETIVEEELKFKEERKSIIFKEKSHNQQQEDTSSLYDLPGVSVINSGGPLSSSSITYRGLSPTRLRIDLEGLNLNNPATGLVDASSLFLFAAQYLGANGPTISINLPNFDKTKAKGLLGAGFNNTLKVGMIAGTSLQEDSEISAAVQLSQTNGDFNFYSPDVDIKEQGQGFLRKNNDQRRVQALARYLKNGKNLKAHALMALSLHEGGIPGFAFVPTKNLRNKNIFSGLSLGIAKNIKKTEFSLNISNSFFNQQTNDDLKEKNESTSSHHEVTYGLKMLDFSDWFDLDFSQKIIIEKDYINKKTRLGIGLTINREARLFGPLRPRMFSNFSMLGFSEHGLIFEKDLNFSIDPSSFMTLLFRFARTSRLPTFVELYAENQFFKGNSSLKKEGIWDLELGSIFKLSPIAQLSITAFYGHLTDTILYVPYHAGALRPINSDKTTRLGLDFSFSMTPHKLIKFDSKASILRTKIKNTNAPLPQTPSFSGLTKLKFGSDDFLNITLLSRYRTSTTADIYGSLRTKGYVIFDLTTSWQINRLIGISLALTNLLNQKDLRDSYQMPLPGFSAFAQVEIGEL